MIAVVGDVLLDIVVTPTGPTAPASDTPATIVTRQGGSAASTAAWLAHLGARVRLVGAVGDDGPGGAVTAELADLGVDCTIAISPHTATGTVVAVVTGQGGARDRDMFTSRGASGLLAPTDLPEGWLDDVRHVHVSGYTLLHQGSRAAGVAAIEQSRQANIPISVDPASSAPLRGAGADTFLSWVGSPVLLTPNLDEARVLTGATDPVDAARALGALVGEAVVTCGSAGVIWSDGTELLVRSGQSVPDADPVGAGDAFTAGLLAARMAGRDLARQLAGGIAAAEQSLRSGRPTG